LYWWREEFLKAGQQAMSGCGAANENAKETERLQRHIGERDRVIGELTIANRVL
jgi:hypothetical protein